MQDLKSTSKGVAIEALSFVNPKRDTFLAILSPPDVTTVSARPLWSEIPDSPAFKSIIWHPTKQLVMLGRRLLFEMTPTIPSKRCLEMLCLSHEGFIQNLAI
jgi:hypothetical protein